VGLKLASGVGPTELPQTVAAFHSLVGLAAMAGAAGEFFAGDDLTTGTLSAIYLAILIGGVTFTGSIVAFSKLAGIMGSSPLRLPGRDQLNLAMITTCVLGFAAFLDPSLATNLVSIDHATVQLVSLGIVASMASILGYHLTGQANLFYTFCFVLNMLLLAPPLMFYQQALVVRICRLSLQS
jgi:NAD(P) transhydrogenase